MSLVTIQNVCTTCHIWFRSREACRSLEQVFTSFFDAEVKIATTTLDLYEAQLQEVEESSLLLFLV